MTNDRQRGAVVRRWKVVGAVSALLLTCSILDARAESPPAPAPSGDAPRVALLPPLNLSGLAAPMNEVRLALHDELTARGVDLVGDDELERIMASRRMRDFSGLSREMAKAFRKAGVAAVLLASVDQYDEIEAPKFALTARLVSTTEVPRIVWMDAAALVGDDDPGVLSLGIVHDIGVLVDRAVAELADAAALRLRSSLEAGPARAGAISDGQRRFRPLSYFRAEATPPAHGGPPRIAVLPFANQSGRAFGGELIAQRLVQGLAALPDVEIIEPGVVRQALLEGRVIQQGGASMAQAELVRGLTDADLVVTGRVLDYHDYTGVEGVPVVEFSVRVIDPVAGKVVWVSSSRGRGNAGVFFFDWRRVSSAQRLADEMVQAIVGRMFGGPRARKQPSAD